MSNKPLEDAYFKQMDYATGATAVVVGDYGRGYMDGIKEGYKKAYEDMEGVCKAVLDKIKGDTEWQMNHRKNTKK